MATISINTGNQGFLANSFVQHSNPARLCISAETEDFDTETLLNWQNEGFEIAYVPYGDGGKEYLSRLNPVKESLGVGDSYAIIGMYIHTMHSPFIHIPNTHIDY